MEKIYIVIIVLLFILAISDLVVGVANDAVNFLNSAIGSKAASLRVILIVAGLGIIVGTTFSSGMMEVARKGIFHPEAFSFNDVMIIFLAVMITDVLLLDLFNTFGLPTSTTVSIIFELLGASVGIAALRIMNSDTESIANIASYINSAKALAIISGILVSVAISLTVGTTVMYLSRMLFSFKYEGPLKYFGALWGGIAISAITYFMLIKGAKGSSFITKESLEWITKNTFLILVGSLVFWTVLMQILVWVFKVNILRIIVLVGTFALAMAFAGNDLVNFIGVPLAGFEAFKDFLASGASVGAESFMMNSLSEKVKTPTEFLLIAGLVMVITLWLSKKARTVIKTELRLSDQEETSERFESSAMARTLVRQAIKVNKSIRRLLPERITTRIDSRFDATYFQQVIKKEQGVNFDLVRASVNLVVSSILIAMGTALKLPLSTTYVTFMVAMGTSLADGAWDRESAVYRITGVITVIGGWFFTAISAFTITLLVAVFLAKTFPYGIFVTVAIASFILYRTHILHNKKMEEEESELKIIEVSEDSEGSYEACKNYLVSILIASNKALTNIFDGVAREKRKVLKESLKTVRKLNNESKKLKKNIPATIQKLNEETFESGHHYIELIDYIREAMHSLSFIAEPSFKYVENNHKPLTEFQKEILQGLSISLNAYIDKMVITLSNTPFENDDQRISEAMELIELITKARKRQIKQMKKEPGSTRTNLLILDIFSEMKNFVLNINNTYKSFRDFTVENQKNVPTKIL